VLIDCEDFLPQRHKDTKVFLIADYADNTDFCFCIYPAVSRRVTCSTALLSKGIGSPPTACGNLRCATAGQAAGLNFIRNKENDDLTFVSLTRMSN
jgi:hypothetical protein